MFSFDSWPWMDIRIRFNFLTLKMFLEVDLSPAEMLISNIRKAAAMHWDRPKNATKQTKATTITWRSLSMFLHILVSSFVVSLLFLLLVGAREQGLFLESHWYLMNFRASKMMESPRLPGDGNFGGKRNARAWKNLQKKRETALARWEYMQMKRNALTATCNHLSSNYLLSLN